MCGVAAALAAASVGMTGLQAYGQYKSGKENAAVANANATIKQNAANDAVNRGNANADQARQKYRQMAGSQAAAIAANGGEIGSGTSLDIFGDTAQQGALDALTTVNNAEREAYGYKIEAANYRGQAKAAGNTAAFTTLLTAPLQAAGMYQMAGGNLSTLFSSGAGAGGGATSNMFSGLKTSPAGSGGFTF